MVRETRTLTAPALRAARDMRLDRIYESLTRVVDINRCSLEVWAAAVDALCEEVE